MPKQKVLTKLLLVALFLVPLGLLTALIFPRIVSADIISDLEAHWEFNDDLLDTTASGFDLSATTSASYTSGFLESALDADGNYYVYCTDANCGGASGLDISGGKSASVWVYLENYPTTWYGVMGKGTTDASEMFTLLIGNQGGLYTDFGSSCYYQTTNNQVPLDEWTHIVISHSGTVATPSIAVNGSYIGDYISRSTVGCVNDTTGDFQIGSSRGSSIPFTGLIDEVKVYSRELDADDVQELYDSYFQQVCPASVQARFQVDGLGLHQSGTFAISTLDSGGEFQWSAVMNQDVNQTFIGEVTLTEPDLTEHTYSTANGRTAPTPHQLGDYSIEARSTNGELCDTAAITVVADPANGLVAPPSGIGVETEDDGTDVTTTPNLGTEWVYVRDGAGDIVGKIQVDLDTGRDWRAMQVGRRAPAEAGDTGAAVLHYPGGAANIPGIVGSWYYLYVPRDTEDIAVRVCPGAESVNQVGSTCGGGLTLTEGTTGQYTVTKVNLEGDDLWEISGVTGTGGIGVNLSTARAFTLTPSVGSVSSTTEVTVDYTPTSNFGIGDTIAVDFDTGGSFVLANCGTATVDADGDTTTDGAGVATTNGGANNDRFLYTFTAATTTANTSGISLCIAVTSPSTAGNYQVDLYDSLGGYGSAIFYVGNENQVNIAADVDTVFTFDIRNSGDTGDLPNVDGLSTGPNLCDLGNLTDAGVQTCSYRLKVTTNANSGYTVNISTDGSLRNSDDSEFIDNVTEDTTVASGIEGYGIAFVGGSCTEGILAELGDFDDDDTPTATAVTTGIDTSLYRCYDANNPSSTDTTNTALVTHRAESDSGTPAGTYTQLVTYTISGSF